MNEVQNYKQFTLQISLNQLSFFCFGWLQYCKMLKFLISLIEMSIEFIISYFIRIYQKTYTFQRLNSIYIGSLIQEFIKIILAFQQMKQKRQVKKSKSKSVPKTKSVNKESSKNKKIVRVKTLQKREIQLDYKVQQEGHTYKVKLHKQYLIDQKHALYKSIENLMQRFIEKEKGKDEHYYDMTQYTYFPMFEFHLAQENPAHQKCSICQFEFQQPQDYEKELLSHNDQDIIRLKCSHLLHWNCFKMLIGDKQWLKCPVCSTIYGYMVGDQPDGVMTTIINKLMHCDGYEDCGTIIISYSMKSGTRGNISFPSTHRTAYLPDNEKGHEVLDLLKKAFDRKLIFTIGRSVTTGRDNQIVWNGIHHKTNLSGGSAYFGYPDETYFDRVKLELAMKGIY